MQKLLDLKKKDIPIETPEENDSGELESLNQKVREATKTREFEEKRTELEVRKQENEISNMEHMVEIAALKLRERTQEYRLCELKIKELKRQTRHTALKPLEFEPNSNNPKTSENESYREIRNDSTLGRSENSNLREQLRIAELTEANVKLHDEQLRQDEDSEFYSNVE